MATATVRNVDDDDYAALTEMAEANQRSVSAELRAMIAEQARRHRAEKLIVEMRAIRKRNALKLPDGRTMLDLLREERDSW
ncbi:hypothetical protein GCM10011494_10250 [Novosphingobium endophyticum]|uniref:Antitoxin FitA-like ribbon-helix-helix domain-containing protein n=1 Tax=Novosphingobium endophyticum TaxID=1955250 RepID=A0A916TQK6_9SPHN|nr:ribbon-helix-helix protein, CopG family [Novosphingobium endophyticum]GGB93759.1 hypothetical protein GCM10011494_10250 [Novosphingobium endophyticum]